MAQDSMAQESITQETDAQEEIAQQSIAKENGAQENTPSNEPMTANTETSGAVPETGALDANAPVNYDDLMDNIFPIDVEGDGQQWDGMLLAPVDPDTST